MSDAGVAVTRAVFEAMNAGDIDRMATYIAPDAELYPMRAQLEGTSYRGPDGLRELMAVLYEDWEYVQMDIAEIREGDDGIATLGHLRTKGRVSGVDVDVPMGWHARIRDGQLLYVKAFSDPADALRAAGIEPGGG